jgi:hypothetical protein
MANPKNRSSLNKRYAAADVEHEKRMAALGVAPREPVRHFERSGNRKGSRGDDKFISKLVEEAIARLAAQKAEPPPLPSPSPLEPPGPKNALPDPTPLAKAPTGQPGPSASIPEAPPTDAQKRAYLELLEEKVRLGKPKYSDVEFD